MTGKKGKVRREWGRDGRKRKSRSAYKLRLCHLILSYHVTI